MTNTDLAPANQCIYCGTAEGELTKEHIIALSLGGRIILPKASCDACSEVTKKLEESFARGTLGEFRSFHELPTRRKNNRIKTVKIGVKYGKLGLPGKMIGQPEQIDVPISDAPLTYILPTYSIKNSNSDGIFSSEILEGTQLPDTERNVRFQQLIQKHGIQTATISSRGYEVGIFQRVLWKIVLGIGWHYFNKSLKSAKISQIVLKGEEVFLSNPSTGERLVRNIFSSSRSAQSNKESRIAIFTKEIEKVDFIHVEIDIFAQYGFPIYCCVLPNLEAELTKRHEFG